MQVPLLRQLKSTELEHIANLCNYGMSHTLACVCLCLCLCLCVSDIHISSGLSVCLFDCHVSATKVNFKTHVV